jgi:hypothetical protein
MNHSILKVPLFFKQGSSTLHYNLGEAEAPGFIPGGSFLYSNIFPFFQCKNRFIATYGLCSLCFHPGTLTFFLYMERACGELFKAQTEHSLIAVFCNVRNHKNLLKQKK